MGDCVTAINEEIIPLSGNLRRDRVYSETIHADSTTETHACTPIEFNLETHW